MDNTALKGRMSGKIQELQQPGEVAAAPDTSLAPANSAYLALTSNALDIIRANLKSQPLTLDLFDLVKSPSGGSTVFEVPGLAGNEAEKELVGIVLDYTTPRAYWDTSDPVEGTPPVCMSQNSIISFDGKACAHCPYNDFGSKDGESNAKIANIIEYGKHGQPPKPFLKPAKTATRDSCAAAMRQVFDEEVGKL